MKYRFADLIDVDKLQQLVETFCAVAEVSLEILDPDLKTLSGAGEQDVCRRFHSLCPETKKRCHISWRRLFARYPEEEGTEKGTCGNGLACYGVPIIVDGHYLAVMLAGQFFREPPDEKKFREQARQCGFNEQDYLEALRRVPVMPVGKREAVAKMVDAFAQLLAEMGLTRLIQLETIDLLCIRGQELKKTNEQFLAIANFTYDWESWIGVDGKLLWVNPAVERITGYSPEECLEMEDYPLRIVRPEDRRRIENILKERQYAKEGNDLTFQIIRKDGTQRWVAMSWQTICQGDGNDMGLRLSVRDVTDRCLAEQAVAASEERFAKAFFSSPVPMAILSMEQGALWEVNEALLTVTGYRKAEVIGRSLQELGVFVEDKDRQELRTCFLQEGVLRQREFHYRRKDGQVGMARVSAESVQIDGQLCMLATVLDITEQKRYERQLRHVAYYDMMTGLPNRRLFEDRLSATLAHARRQDEAVAVMYLDFGGYKAACAGLPEEIDWQFVREITDRLMCSVPEVYTVARLDDTSFGLIVPNIQSRDDALRFANRLLDSFKMPFALNRKKVMLTLTIGMNFFPDDGKDAKTFMNKNDQRLAKWSLSS
ncbi:MAG TPA: PocR ligand-binding domain-containing protein [Patescibacteria group bacterium]|nr:PocR ligand-binding domain-containing protein [Patescibacteria group bacterium]